jgi:hypothetical protein
MISARSSGASRPRSGYRRFSDRSRSSCGSQAWASTMFSERATEDRVYRRQPYGTDAMGEIFFANRDVYYCLNLAGSERYIETADGRTFIEPVDGGGVEIGLLSRASDGTENQLLAFGRAFESATKASLDGRKTRHLQFEWKPVVVAARRPASVESSEVDEPQVRFQKAVLDQPGISAAQALSTPISREIIIEISQAGMVRERDLVGRRSKRQDEVRSVVEMLKVNGLIAVEYIIECKKSGAPLSRIDDPDRVASGEVKMLLCPSCGSSFADEVISPAYTVSPLGRSCIQKSHWMTIWVTDQLTQAGVPIESILWNVSESGEEVDLLVDFLGQIWIFELKDREFGAGDAHPFNYRRVRYNAQKAIVISTDKVSRDARRVFDDLSRDRQQRSAQPVFVEGLENVRVALEKEVSKATVRYACNRLGQIEAITGFDISNLISTLFADAVQSSAAVSAGR